MLKRIFALNFLDAFIFGVTAVAVPLLLLDRGVDLATIGIVLSLAPLAKLFMRLASAAFAESAGERVFYSLNSAGNFGQAVAYALATTPLGFAAGRFLDGARESFLWAVNRSSLMAAAPHSKHFVLAGMVAGRQVYFAIGSLAVGLLFPLGGFGLVFGAIAAVAAIGFAVSLGVKNTHSREKVRLSEMAMLGRDRGFYETAATLAVGSVFYSLIVYILMPIYFHLSGYSLQQIGIFYAAYFLVFGVMLQSLSSRRAKSKSVAAAGAFLFIASLMGMSFAGPQSAPYFFLLMAMGDGHLAFIWEHLIYLRAKKAEKPSLEIALLHTPGGIVMFAATALSGLALAAFGFAPLFLAGALSLAIYAAMSVRLCEGDK